MHFSLAKHLKTEITGHTFFWHEDIAQMIVKMELL